MPREATITPKTWKKLIDSISRTLFVDAWATKQENLREDGKKSKDPGPGGDWFDIAPKTNAEARNAAHQLIGRIEQLNGWNLPAIFNQAVVQGGKDDPDKFGHYLAMQALGHGVAWTDTEPEFGLPEIGGKMKKFKLPHIEFYL